jgi:hypothetical protein
MKLAIFLPGLQLQPQEPNLERYALRLQKALDIVDQTGASQYTLKMSKEKLGPGDGEELDVATIKLNIPTQTVDYYKIYSFDYAGLLTGELKKHGPLYQYFHLVRTMLTSLPQFYSYLKHPERKAIIARKFDTLLEYIANQHPRIGGIELHTCGFGSIIACDLLFPNGPAPGERIRSRIQLLITIRSPHDFIKNYYPDYFRKRKRYILALTHWYNVYSPSTILSSNFRCDSKPGSAEFGIVQGGLLPENINYKFNWASDEEVTSCLTTVVRAIQSPASAGGTIVVRRSQDGASITAF